MMNYKDQLSKHYSEILDGVYECADRIVINGYFRPGYTGGGFRNWWRDLKGSEEKLDNNHLMRMAGRFSRRIQAFTKKEDIPLIYCKPHERKHELAEQYIPQDKNFNGIFLILVSRSTGHVWDVERSSNGSNKIRNLKAKKPYPFVNHYWFHIMDKKWGHITIKMCAHPPFGVQIMLNGHEWVEREALSKKLSITKEGNCFTYIEDSEDLCKIADTLYKRGHLREVCDGWVYLCLWFGLSKEEQEKTGFHYQYSLCQGELSRNFLFQRGTKLDEIYQNIIDLTRRHLDVKKLTTIFGFKHRPHSRKHKKTSFQVRIRIERPKYNMTIFKILDGKIVIKIYDKGARAHVFCE